MRVLVVDIETTGLCGCPQDLVVEVAVADADTSSGRVGRIYSEVVGYDVSSWDDGLKGSWIFSHSDLTLEDVASGVPMDDVAEDVRRLLLGRPCTSYNREFDLGRFLSREPWGARPRSAPCVMLRASRLVEGDYLFSDGSTSWPRLSKAYAELCPEDPAAIGGEQTHRALDDALMAAYVLIELVARGEYPAAIPEDCE